MMKTGLIVSQNNHMNVKVGQKRQRIKTITIDDNVDGDGGEHDDNQEDPGSGATKQSFDMELQKVDCKARTKRGKTITVAGELMKK